MKLSEISAIIKTQIQNFEAKITASEEGKIISMGDGIALIDGLDKAMLGELLLFPGNTFGMVLNLEEDVVGAVLMGSDAKIREGDTVRRTGKIIEVPVGNELLGRVVNALGQQIDGGKEIKTTKNRPIERIAPGVMTRKSVDEPLETGIISIDSMIPIGKGQRELIIGDRQIGKTAVAIDVIINQKGKNVKCVYVAIGQKNSTVVQVVEKLKEHDAMDYVVIVSATASQQASLQYLAPYAGVTMAEEWMEKGEDVLIVYDDLTKHAIAYRTLSLLLRRPPGREAFPGDVFYLHSRLLERAAKLNDKHGGGSITALPIIETQAGDISAYIPTNVISITDGQLFMMSDLFNSGQRPAVDSAYSVSRVGSSAQIKAMKKVSGSLRLELAQYKELKSFSQFGSDIDSETKAVLDHGERAMSFLKQPQYSPLSQSLQVIMLLAVKERLTGYIPIEYIEEFKKAIVQKFTRREATGVLKKLDEVKDLDEKMIEEIIFQLKMCVIKVCRKHPNYDYNKHPDHPAHELNEKYDEQKSIRDQKRAEDANNQYSDETNQPKGSEKEIDQKQTTSPATTSKPKLAKLEEVKEDDQKEVEKQPTSPVDSTERSTNEKEVKGSDQKPAEKTTSAPQGIEKIISEADKEVIEDMELPENEENLNVKQIKTLNEKKKEANLPVEDIAHSLDPLPKKAKFKDKKIEKNNQNAKYSSNKTKN